MNIVRVYFRIGSNARKHIKTFHEKPENAREICDNCFTNRIMLAIDECRVGALQQLLKLDCNFSVQLHGFTLLTHASLLRRSYACVTLYVIVVKRRSL